MKKIIVVLLVCLLIGTVLFSYYARINSILSMGYIIGLWLIEIFTSGGLAFLGDLYEEK